MPHNFLGVLILFAPILFWTSLGLVIGRFILPAALEEKRHHYSDLLVSYVANIATPLLIIATFSRLNMSLNETTQVMLAGFMYLLFTVIISFLILRIHNKNFNLTAHGMIFGNVGNLGLPVSYYLFHSEGLEYAISFFVVLVSAQFFLTPIFLGDKSFSLSQFFKVPVVIATCVGLIIYFTNFHLSHFIYQVIAFIGSTAIPLSLISLGMTLSNIYALLSREIFIFSIYRILIGIVTAFLVNLVFGFDGILQNVIWCIGMMPTAVFCYLFAHKYKKNESFMAGLVLGSTVLSFILLPIALAVINLEL